MTDDPRLAQLAAWQESCESLVKEMIRDKLAAGLPELEESRDVRA